MIISSSSFALTPEEQAFGGFATSMICSHPSDLSFCFDATQSDAATQACYAWMSYMQAGQTGTNSRQYSYVKNNGRICDYSYIVTATGTQGFNSQPLTTRSGMCPTKGQPPPKQIVFSRQGRWFPQELGSDRCFEKCEYNISSTTFDYKHYVFTNGVVTEFKENMSRRATSKGKFCFAPAEPIRNTEGETTYDANCDDAFLTVFCEFVEWYRSDSEMPEAPEVKKENLDIPSYLKTDHFDADPNTTADMQCFAPLSYSFYLAFSQTEVAGEFSFIKFCAALSSIAHLLKAGYLLFAAFIIFRR